MAPASNTLWIGARLSSSASAETSDGNSLAVVFTTKSSVVLQRTQKPVSVRRSKHPVSALGRRRATSALQAGGESSVGCSRLRASAIRVACCGRVAAAQQVKSSSTGAPARVASTQQQHLPPDALLVMVTNRRSPRQHTQKSSKKLYQLPELAGHARRKRPPRVRETAAQSTSRVGCWASAIIAAHHHFHFGRLSPSRITWTSAGCSTAVAM